MAAPQQDTMFGDDINSTPLTKLQQMPAMSSKNDPGAPGPLEPPVYSPTVQLEHPQHPAPPPPPKQVRFQDDDLQNDLQNDRRLQKDRRSRRREREQRKQRDQYRYMMPPQPVYQFPPQQQQQPPAKAAKLAVLLRSYGHPLLVFALVLVVLWYHPRVAGMPYLGAPGGAGLSTLGKVAAAFCAAGAYGALESLVD